MVFRNASRVPGLLILLGFSLGAAIYFWALFKPRLFKAGRWARLFETFLTVTQQSKWLSSVGLGFLMPLLPCGLLWMALAEAAIVADPLGSSLTMSAFALGTTPALVLGRGVFGFLMKFSKRQHPKAPLFFAAALGVLLWGWTYFALVADKLPCH